MSGYHFAVEERGGAVVYQHSDREDPREDWIGTHLEGAKYHRVKRAPGDHEVWNGKDGWKLDLEPIRRTRKVLGRRARDAAMAAPVQTSYGPVKVGPLAERMIERLARVAAADPKFTTRFKFADGVRPMTAPELIDMALQVDRRLLKLMGAQIDREERIDRAKSRPKIHAVKHEKEPRP